MAETLAVRALRALVATINATGGVKTDSKGLTVPVVDEEWCDLGDAYELACRALRQKPKFEEKGHA